MKLILKTTLLYKNYFEKIDKSAFYETDFLKKYCALCDFLEH